MFRRCAPTGALLLTAAVSLAGEDTGACPALSDVNAILAEDKREIPRPARLDPGKAAKRFARDFAPLYATITTNGKPFSASQMLDDLWDLYPLAQAAGTCSPELARLLSTIAIVEIKRREARAGLVFGEAALQIDVGTHALPIGDAFFLHHELAESAAGPLGQPDKAVAHMREALRLEPEVPGLDQLQRFGVRQSLGYWLFEAGKYAEARDVNLALLTDAEKALGPEDEALSGVLENLAQDHYKLGEPDKARSFLERCLALARKHQSIEVESSMLFQLGVLAHETGDDALARRYMQQRIERVSQKDGNPDMRAEARASFDELEERILEKK
jgi:tetratricopeptide (TPR) repeat protein